MKNNLQQKSYKQRFAKLITKYCTMQYSVAQEDEYTSIQNLNKIEKFVSKA